MALLLVKFEQAATSLGQANIRNVRVKLGNSKACFDKLLLLIYIASILRLAMLLNDPFPRMKVWKRL